MKRSKRLSAPEMNSFDTLAPTFPPSGLRSTGPRGQCVLRAKETTVHRSRCCHVSGSLGEETQSSYFSLRNDIFLARGDSLGCHASRTSMSALFVHNRSFQRLVLLHDLPHHPSAAAIVCPENVGEWQVIPVGRTENYSKP